MMTISTILTYTRRVRGWDKGDKLKCKGKKNQRIRVIEREPKREKKRLKGRDWNGERENVLEL